MEQEQQNQTDPLLRTLFNVAIVLTRHNPKHFNHITIRYANQPNWDIDQWTTQALELYKSRHSNRKISTIDVSPKAWVEEFRKVLSYEITKQTPNLGDTITIKIPNGCCSLEDCPIKLFYETLSKIMLSSSKAQEKSEE